MKEGTSLDGLGTGGKGQSKFAQKVLSTQKQPPAPTLFFGNLGFETTVESIRGLLEAHRAKELKNETVSSEPANNNGAKDAWIRKIRMGTFEDSGLCKGYLIQKRFCISKTPADWHDTPGLHLSISRARSTQLLL